MYNKNQLAAFLIGLIEGDGTITVGFSSNQFRVSIAIALKNHIANIDMLKLLQSHFGGRLNIYNKLVVLKFDNKIHLFTIFNLFDTYPFLTSRKTCQ